MAPQSLELVCMTITIVCQLAFLGKLLHTLVRGIPSWARSFLFLHSSRRSHVDGDAEDEVEREEVRNLVSTRRLHFAKRATITLGAVHAICGIQLILEASDGSAWTLNSKNLLPRTLLIVVSTPPCFISRFFTRQLLPWMLMWVMMGLLCWITMMEWDDSSVGAIGPYVVSIAAIPHCLIFLSFRSLILPNLCLTMCLIATRLIQEDPEEITPQRSISIEIVSLLFRLALLFFGDSALWAWSKVQVKAASQGTEMSAVLALLRLVCDVIAKVDEHAELKEHSETLACMLMHGPGRQLKGQSLSAFVADAVDRGRLDKALGRSDEGVSERREPPPASMLSLALRDSFNNRVGSTMYILPFASIDHKVEYYIGIREDADVASPQRHGGEMAASRLRPELADRLSSLRQQPSAPSRSWSSRSRGSGPLCIEDQGPIPDAGRSAEVYLRPGMPVRWVHPDVEKEFGLCANEGDSGHPAPEFAGLIKPRTSNAERDEEADLLHKIQECMVYTSSRCRTTSIERCNKCLGEWDMLQRRSGGPEGGSGTIVRRELWVTFCIPIAAVEPGKHTVTISICPAAAATRGGDGIQSSRSIGSAGSRDEASLRAADLNAPGDIGGGLIVSNREAGLTGKAVATSALGSDEPNRKHLTQPARTGLDLLSL